MNEQQPETVTAKAGQSGRTILVAAASAVIILIGAAVIVFVQKATQEHTLAEETSKIAADAPEVEVTEVKASPATQAFVLPGETAAWYQSTVYARVDGYIRDWKVDIGDRVKKDQLLCDIETPELDANLAAAKAKLTASNAAVKVAQADTDFAKSTYDRWWQSPKGVVSEQERQEKKSAYDSSLAKLESAKADIALSQADVDRYTAFEAYKQVTAPFDGIATQRRIDIGDLVTSGSSTSTTSLYTVAQSDEIRTFIDVPQRVSRGMDTGLEADITSDEFPGRTFNGKIARTANSVDPASRTLHVEVDVPNKDLSLVPGMYVEVHFELKASPAIAVPAAAMLYPASGPKVAVVDRGDKVQFKSVTIGRDHGDTLDISDGLIDGDRVALNISSDIAEGETVSTQKSQDVSTPPIVAVAGEAK